MTDLHDRLLDWLAARGAYRGGVDLLDDLDAWVREHTAPQAVAEALASADLEPGQVQDVVDVAFDYWFWSTVDDLNKSSLDPAQVLGVMSDFLTRDPQPARKLLDWFESNAPDLHRLEQSGVDMRDIAGVAEAQASDTTTLSTKMGVFEELTYYATEQTYETFIDWLTQNGDKVYALFERRAR